MFKRRKRHKHEWSNWQEAQLVMIRMRDGQKIPYIGQMRTCATCGWREFD